jgi:hypothetical protein
MAAANNLAYYPTATIASIKSWLKSGDNQITFFAVYLPTIRGKVDRFITVNFFMDNLKRPSLPQGVSFLHQNFLFDRKL